MARATAAKARARQVAEQLLEVGTALRVSEKARHEAEEALRAPEPAAGDASAGGTSGVLVGPSGEAKSLRALGAAGEANGEVGVAADPFEGLAPIWHRGAPPSGGQGGDSGERPQGLVPGGATGAEDPARGEEAPPRRLGPAAATAPATALLSGGSATRRRVGASTTSTVRPPPTQPTSAPSPPGAAAAILDDGTPQARIAIIAEKNQGRNYKPVNADDGRRRRGRRTGLRSQRRHEAASGRQHSAAVRSRWRPEVAQGYPLTRACRRPPRGHTRVGSAGRRQWIWQDDPSLGADSEGGATRLCARPDGADKQGRCCTRGCPGLPPVLAPPMPTRGRPAVAARGRRAAGLAPPMPTRGRPAVAARGRRAAGLAPPMPTRGRPAVVAWGRRSGAGSTDAHAGAPSGGDVGVRRAIGRACAVVPARSGAGQQHRKWRDDPALGADSEWGPTPRGSAKGQRHRRLGARPREAGRIGGYTAVDGPTGDAVAASARRLGAHALGGGRGPTRLLRGRHGRHRPDASVPTRSAGGGGRRGCCAGGMGGIGPTFRCPRARRGAGADAVAVRAAWAASARRFGARARRGPGADAVVVRVAAVRAHAVAATRYWRGAEGQRYMLRRCPRGGGHAAQQLGGGVLVDVEWW
jgi:hypothetical protein